MTRSSGLALAFAMALGSVGAQAAPVIVNGSFETASLSGWGGTATTDGHGYNPFGTTYGSGMDGTHWMWLAGYDTERTLSQTITGLTAGSAYRILFIMASEYTHGDQLNVSIDGGAQTLFTAPSIKTTFWDNWLEQGYDFTASGSSASLLFSSVGLNKRGYDVGLDNVRIQASNAVPEPASLGLVVLGVAALGFSTRRKPKQPA